MERLDSISNLDTCPILISCRLSMNPFPVFFLINRQKDAGPICISLAVSSKVIFFS
jgi:hypothetical protein